MLDTLKSLVRPRSVLRSLTPRRAMKRPKIVTPSATNLAPVVVIACGAGMAFWWWSQWVRAREEEGRGEADDNLNPVSSEAGAESCPPSIHPSGEVSEIVGPAALHELDESLAVQADAEHARAAHADAAPLASA